jgi:hypothetical protein
MPEVALVELPPPKALRSSNSTRAPYSRAVCAADMPDNPAPITMICFFEFISYIGKINYPPLFIRYDVATSYTDD